MASLWQVAPANCYSGTVSMIVDIFPRMGVDATFVSAGSVEAYEKAIRPTTKV